ncbi:HAD family hydrolase [Aliarcobacter cryaerophilus]|jgi:phosphoglycolate phosphatase|uniref:HAD family hydrolase n=1 Tax=Aliarcobacter TaxID=2321111 RepID=UPI0009CFAD39|nr:HAD family hydrolase [Aliarcobacter cryaerophilus]OQA75115.1 MAG: Phosphoglycolate phosphatase [Candidatus Dependentiae bacterium ADurb.Bin246]MCT7472775.1 HAD family hydrolase [Aliarcobacter cryaerophilus]MCT7493433.1 HAD family hydrolase [Aliarcobacter cryaerophilus]MCT7500102.1 HAD family hydrolase [Aliarcobacter cryaerophilus]MCT7501007.1 HAD family hydrolase [Aliarcobacter cryaerophilus]
MKKTVIFDLDGTLLDSIEDIASSMNKVLESLQLPTHKIEDYKHFVGGGVDILVENALSNQSKEIKDEVIKRFKIEYDGKLHSKTLPYDGIYELLDELKKLDINLAVLSNKPHEFTVSYVNHFFKNYNFKEIHGQKKDVPKKPDPKAALDIVKCLDSSCENTYFIGDTKIDMQTAKSANMTAIGVLWGFRDEKELRDFGADFIVSNPLEILKIIK